MFSSPPRKTILVLAANPKNTDRIRLDEEVREIEDGLKQAKQRDRFILKHHWATRSRDVQQVMLDVMPQIVHFSGHGVGDQGLIFEDRLGRAKPISGRALAGLFKLFADQVECVLLNACHSQVQAEAIAKHIPTVIGMSQAIGDRAAIEYALAFYRALGAGRTFKFAHDLGCNAIELAGIDESLTPVFIQKEPIPDKSKSTKSAHLFISYSTVVI